MKKIVFLFLVFSFLLISCSSESKPKDESGTLNHECKTGNICDAGLACKDNKCVTEADACYHVTCLGHGSCIVENSKAVCDCENGFVREGDIKCVASSVCNGIICSNHGTCEEVNGSPKCNCEEGYSTDATGERCIENLDPCANINCGGVDRGTCQSSGGVLECVCKNGYHVQGLNCVSDSNPCDGVDCGGTDKGTCEVNGSDANCNCKTGFIASGLTCVDETNNPCDGQNCSGHGACEIHNNEATCICQNGYNPGQNLTCLGGGTQTDACKDVDCADGEGVKHGDCHVDENGNAACLCDEGYIRANYMCIAEFGSPCYEQTCSAHGVCKVKTGEAFCDCSTGFYPSSNLTCVDKATICTTSITCSGHGICDVNADGTPTCDCDDGYTAVGTECIVNPCDPNPCVELEGSTGDCRANADSSYSCTCNGLCDDGNNSNDPQDSQYYWDQDSLSCLCGATCENAHMHPENGTCVCDTGYVADGEYCVLEGGACDSNPCASISNTKCIIAEDTENGYRCLCKDDYAEDQFGNCVAPACADSPCEDNIDDENRTKCVADGPDTHHCECANGFVDNGGVCESETNMACNTEPCNGAPNSTGVCIPGPVAIPDLYMCQCNQDYGWDFNTNGGECVSCTTCASKANATGNCEVGFDGTQICECEDSYEYIIDDQGNGSCELTTMP